MKIIIIQSLRNWNNFWALLSRRYSVGDRCFSHSSAFLTIFLCFLDVHVYTFWIFVKMNASRWICAIFCAVLLMCELTVQLNIENLSHESVSPRLCYSPTILKSLRPTTTKLISFYHNQLPPEIRKRRRGRRGGVRARYRRRASNPPLPAVITGNARSLNNKLDELSANARFMNEYRESGLICITESWFTENQSGSGADIDNFSLYRTDRTSESLKSRGGGVCAYVNNNWCSDNNTYVIHNSCSPDIEILSLSLRPFYLPREFPKIILNVVYIPPSANENAASNTITDLVHGQQSKTPDAVIVITGDLNHCSIDSCLPNFTQYVKEPTRKDKLLDLCYCNVKNAYKSLRLPPLANSDHCMTLLLPKYRSVLKRNKPEKKIMSILTEAGRERLQDCFECTDWNLFIESCKDIETLNETVTEYIKFCEDIVCEKKQVTTFSNDKPWLTKEINYVLKEKKLVFRLADDKSLQEANRRVNETIENGKRNYKNKLEAKFKEHDLKATWDGMKEIVGYNKKKSPLDISKSAEEYANDLNTFYARFDTNDFQSEIDYTLNGIMQDSDYNGDIVLDEHEVRRALKGIKANKACGPDGLKGRTLKFCCDQLSFIYTYISNLSLLTHHVPLSWKTSEIIPIPKKGSVKELNDLRPVALTSIAMKCLERIVLKYITSRLSPIQDPLQFAYRSKRCVDDALTTFVDNIYRHIDSDGNFCRVLFVDFSSAFNTIQPHLILSKLHILKVNTNIIAWVHNFLTSRQQYVKLSNFKQENDPLNEMKSVMSKLIKTNTGAPQGCILSPILFTVYTNDCRTSSKNVHCLKYADDTAIQGLISTSEQQYRDEVHSFVDWCDRHFLLLNVKNSQPY